MSAAEVLAFGVRRRFGDHLALDGVDLSLSGGLIVLLGPNGAGKTTLLRALATVDQPDEGNILIDGLDPRHPSDRTEIRRRLGYQPQQPMMAPRSKVFDVIDYLASLKEHHHERSRRNAVRRALEEVGLADRLSDRVGELSGGMRQRLGVAQALLGSPTLLLLDEPSAGLDPDERIGLREALARRRHQATIVVSTHLTEEATAADLVLVLHQGRIRFVGSPADLAGRAAGRTWISDIEPAQSRAAWRLPDGRYRCLGQPPPGVEPSPPT
jgi:ABC-2 type transport system ATP-binding protein